MIRYGLVCLLIACAPLSAQRRTFYVSPAGNDAWSGTLAAPDSAAGNGPFRTFAGARDALRQLRAAGRLYGGAAVLVRAGSYDFAATLTLTAADSGTRRAPIVWKASGTVELTGGRRVTGIVPVTDTSVLARLAPAARANVLVADLAALGITRYGEILPRGGPPMEFFCGGGRMTVARYPNEGWLLIRDVPQTCDSMINRGLDREKRFAGVPAGRHYGRIAYDDPRPARWKKSPDIFMQGYWTFDWSDSYQRVESIDTAKKEITIAPPHHWYGYTARQRYYYMNILEELDAPGEWYLDRAAGRLYFWPPDAATAQDARVSLLEDPIISVDSSAWIRFEGFRFRYSRGRGMTVTGGHHIDIAGCDFRNLGREAVVIDGARASGVSRSEITETGLGGIILRGGTGRRSPPRASMR